MRDEFEAGLGGEGGEGGERAKGGLGFRAGFATREGEGAAAEVDEEHATSEDADEAGFEAQLDVIVFGMEEGKVAAERFIVIKGLAEGAPAGAEQREFPKNQERFFPEGEFCRLRQVSKLRIAAAFAEGRLGCAVEL